MKATKNSRTGKSTVVAAVICILVIVAVLVAAAAVNILLGPQNAQVDKLLATRAYVDGVYWEPGTSINWSILNPGQTYSKNLTVYNGSNDVINVSVIVTDLPAGWLEIWTANETVNLARNTSAMGDFNLTVAAYAPPGNYTWNTSLDVT